VDRERPPSRCATASRSASTSGRPNADPTSPASTCGSEPTSVYIDGRYPDGAVQQLCRLRYGGVLHTWGFAPYRTSHDDDQDNDLPNSIPVGASEEALDCTCGLYLDDPTAGLP